MPEKIQDFAGGVKSTREHLNKLVKAHNELREEFDKLKNSIPGNIVVRVNNLGNTNQMSVMVLGNIMTVDDLFCCGGSGDSHGGA